MPRIIINTTKNDDWIRSLPGYQNEVALINSLEKKRVHKGGKGSGNFGHAGRIGKVGGSRDRSGNFDAWFAGSKVVNADGSPQVVYHGGGAAFTAFNKDYQNKDALYGPGFYFTVDSEVAAGIDPHVSNLEEAYSYGKYNLGGYAVSRPHYGLNVPLTAKDLKRADRLFHSYQVQKDAYDDIGTRQEYKRGYNALQQGIEPFSEWLANESTDWFREKMKVEKKLESTPVAYDVFLSIKKPFDTERMFSRDDFAGLLNKMRKTAIWKENAKIWKKDRFSKPMIDAAFEHGETPGRNVYKLLSANYLFEGARRFSKNEVNRMLQAIGYDGISYIGGRIVGSKEHQVWVAFEPVQIKSVRNQGTFDPLNPDILKELRENFRIMLKGGKGSGNFSHAGRPGHVGGSAAGPGMSGANYQAVTENKNFQAWFRGSKVVDAQGKPLVVFHGTPTHGEEANNRYVASEQAGMEYPEFDTFNTSLSGFTDSGWLGQGSYFTPDPEYAWEFGNKIIPVFLSIKKPFVIMDDSSNGWDNYYRFIKSAQDLEGFPEELKLDESPIKERDEFFADWRSETMYINRGISRGKNDAGEDVWDVVEDFSSDPHSKFEGGGMVEASAKSKGAAIALYHQIKKTGDRHGNFLSTTISREIGGRRFTEILKKAGYDGVIEMHPGKKIPSEILAFYPNQIKSAIGNQGTFDPNEGSILKSLREAMRSSFRGGSGSGNFEHAGRPGQVGGSTANATYRLSLESKYRAKWLGDFASRSEAEQAARDYTFGEGESPKIRKVLPKKKPKEPQKTPDQLKQEEQSRIFNGWSDRNKRKSGSLEEVEKRLSSGEYWHNDFNQQEINKEDSDIRSFLLEKTGAERVWYGHGSEVWTDSVSHRASTGLFLADKNGTELLAGIYEDGGGVHLSHLFKQPAKGVLGVRFMKALKRYCDLTGKPLAVEMVANQRYFSSFDWLTREHDGLEFRYKPQDKTNKGGHGSGNWGHAGRVGKVGGSAAGGRADSFQQRARADSLVTEFRESLLNDPQFIKSQAAIIAARGKYVQERKRLDSLRKQFLTLRQAKGDYFNKRAQYEVAEKTIEEEKRAISDYQQRIDFLERKLKTEDQPPKIRSGIEEAITINKKVIRVHQANIDENQKVLDTLSKDEKFNQIRSLETVIKNAKEKNESDYAAFAYGDEPMKAMDLAVKAASRLREKAFEHPTISSRQKDDLVAEIQQIYSDAPEPVPEETKALIMAKTFEVSRYQSSQNSFGKYLTAAFVRGNAEIKRAVPDSAEFLCSQAQGNFNLFVGKNPLVEVKGKITSYLGVEDRGVAFYGDYAVTPAAPIETHMHELGHVIEERDPMVRALAQRFLSYRTGGEEPVKLNKLYPDLHYSDSEVVKKDKFFHPYAGKIYSTGHTEIVSMGLEAMFQSPSTFAQEDPGYFDFMYALLHLGQV